MEIRTTYNSIGTINLGIEPNRVSSIRLIQNLHNLPHIIRIASEHYIASICVPSSIQIS